MNRRYIRIAISVAVVVGGLIIRDITSGPKPSSQMSTWAKKYEIPDSKTMNQVMTQLNATTSATSASDLESICRAGVAAASHAASDPVPPNQTFALLYSQFLTSYKATFTDCVNGFATGSKADLDAMVSSGAETTNLAAKVNAAGKRLGFTVQN